MKYLYVIAYMAGEKRNIFGDSSWRQFARPFRLFIVPAFCPWVSENEKRGGREKQQRAERNLGEGVAWQEQRLEEIPPQLAPVFLVSLAAVFWVSRNAPPKNWERCVTSQKTAASPSVFPYILEFKISKMSAKPQQQTNEWCRMSQL